MKKSVTILLVTWILLLDGCGNEAENSKTQAEVTPYCFAETRWGMSPQEVLKSRELDFAEIEISGVKVGEDSAFTQYQILAEEKVHGQPAQVTYTFSNLYSSKTAKSPSIGLTAVSVEQEAEGEKLGELLTAYDGLLGGGIQAEGALTLAETDAAAEYRAFWEERRQEIPEDQPLEYASGELDGTQIRVQYCGEGMALLSFLESEGE
ncbi:MAG: hypothetical protein ACOX6P_06475 [Candidatus Merdivicinus sp.]|jgi:hypothetical protein